MAKSGPISFCYMCFFSYSKSSMDTLKKSQLGTPSNPYLYGLMFPASGPLLFLLDTDIRTWRRVCGYFENGHYSTYRK